MRRIMLALIATAAVLFTAGCGTQARDDQERSALRPMPNGVPTSPTYADADAVVSTLGRKGLTCKVIRRPSGDTTYGDQLTCLSKIQGLQFESDIHTHNPAKFSRARVGDAIASRLGYPFCETLVAAGNWYITVKDPDFAPRFAKALGGVVLSPASVDAPGNGSASPRPCPAGR
jgi:hypothetical protein